MRFVATDILDSEEAYGGGSIDNDGAALDEEDESGLVEAGVRTGVTQSGKEEVEEVQRVVKYSSLLSYMLKRPSLLTQVFNNNKKTQKKLFNNMCNFGARAEWRNGRRAFSSYLDVEIRNYKYHLDCISGYIIEDAIGDRAFKRLS